MNFKNPTSISTGFIKLIPFFETSDTKNTNAHRLRKFRVLMQTLTAFTKVIPIWAIRVLVFFRGV